MERIPQPPVNPALRDVERHDFWPGFIAALIGIILTFCGVRHLTAVDTVDGGNAWETQLIKAFAFDGSQYADKMAPPPPPRGDDPEALERWARQNRETRRRPGKSGWIRPPRRLALLELSEFPAAWRGQTMMKSEGRRPRSEMLVQR